MKKTEVRKVEIMYCDFCQKEMETQFIKDPSYDICSYKCGDELSSELLSIINLYPKMKRTEAIILHKFYTDLRNEISNSNYSLNNFLKRVDYWMPKQNGSTI